MVFVEGRNKVNEKEKKKEKVGNKDRQSLEGRSEG